EVGAVDVGDEAKGHVALAIVTECFIGHDGPQVRSANPNIDYIADALAGMSLPLTAPHPVAELTHPSKDGMDFRHDILPIDDDRGPGWSAQRSVKHGPIFRNVDLAAGKHGINPFPQSSILGKPEQQLERLVGDAILRIVQFDADA